MKKLTYSLLLFFFFSGSFFSLKAKEIEFIANIGQWKKEIIAKAHLSNGILIITKHKWTFQLFDYSFFQQRHGNCGEDIVFQKTLKGHNIQYKWVGSTSSKESISNTDLPNNKIISTNSKPIFSDTLVNYSNYFHGKNPNRWKSKIPHYKSLCIRDVYPGIDIQIYSLDGQLKYDYIIHSGYGPNAIQLAINGADSLYLKGDSLVLENGIMTMIETLPLIYTDRPYKVIKGNYTLKDSIVQYQLESQPAEDQKLTIDPALVFSTYSGSYVPNWGFTATHDLGTNTYSGGAVFDAAITDTFPTTPGAFQLNWGGGPGSGYDISFTDAVIMKYNKNGQLLFSTFLGGYGGERPHSLTINNKNELIILGTTNAANFPVTSQAYDTSSNGNWDIFISKLDSSGTQLIASTYMGGSENDGVNIDNSYSVQKSLKFNYADDSRGNISVDENFNIYIASCTRSVDFPTSSYAFQTIFGGGGQDAVVFKFDDQLSQLMYSTFLGGSDDDAAYSSVYKDQVTYITGGTRSTDYPVTPNAVQSIFGGDSADAFISTLNLDGSQLLASTYWGSNRYDQAYFVQLDNESNVYILGQTMDTSHYFLINPQYHDTNGGQFITKFNPVLDSVMFSITFGSDKEWPDISPSAFLVDVCDKIFLSGWGGPLMTNLGYQLLEMPVTANAFQDSTDGRDYYMMVLDNNASSLIYASYIGGNISSEHVDGGTSRFNKKGIIHQAVCAGCFNNSDFPTTPLAWSDSNKSISNCNMATFQFDFEFPTLNTEFSMDYSTGCYPVDISFQSNTSIVDTNNVEYVWDFGDGNSDTLSNPIHTYLYPGEYTAMLIVTDNNTCNIRDTLTKTILIIADSARQIADISICQNGSAQIGILPSIDASATYTWIPSQDLSDPFIANPIAFPNTSTSYQLLVQSGNCTDTLSQKVFILKGETDSLPSKDICINDSIEIGIINTNNFNFHWEPDYQIMDTGQAITTVFPDSTMYYFLIIENNYCSDTIKQRIIVSNYQPYGFNQDSSICRGDAIQIGMPDTLGITYQWTPPTYLNNSGFSQPISIPDSSITYVLAFSQAACRSEDSVQITVFPTPSLSIPGDQRICYGDSIQLNAIGDLNFSWWPATYLNDSSIANPLAYPINTTSYKIQTWNTYNCSNTDSFILTVDSPFTISCGNNDSICAGESYNMFASITEPGTPGTPAPYAYEWAPAAGLNYTNLPNIIATPLQSTQYHIKVTDGHLCTATDSMLIYISPSSPESLGSDTSICYNDSISIGFIDTITALSYHWIPANNLQNDSSSLSLAYPKTSTLYILIPNDTLCQNRDSIFIDVFSLPLAVTNQDTLICIGDTIQLNTSGGINYRWNTQEGLNDSSIANPLCFAIDSQLYIVLVTDSNSCMDTDSVWVGTLYAPDIFAGPDTSICYNTSISIGSIDTIDQNYSWTPGIFLLDSNQSATISSPDSSISYILTHINSQCIIPDTINISVYTRPLIQHTKDTSVCYADTFQLGINGALNYYWQTDSLIINPATDSPLIVVKDTMIIAIAIIDSNLCFSSDSLVITMIPFPIMFAGPDTQICLGDSITIGFTDSSNIDFSWLPTSFLSDSISSITLAFPISNQWYYLIPSDQRCLNIDSLWIKVNTLPATQLNNDTSICQMDSIFLSANGGIQYQWSPDNIISSPQDASSWAFPYDSTYFYVVVIDSNGCNNTDSFYLSMLPTPVFELGEDTFMCLGDSIQLGWADSSGASFLWTNGKAMSDSTSDISYFISDTSQTIFLIVNLGPCEANDSIHFRIDEVNPEAKFDWSSIPTCDGIQINIINNSSLNDQNQWILKEEESMLAQPSFLIPYNTETQIQLLTQSTDGCKDSLIKVISIADIKESLLKISFNVFTPNQDGHNDCFKLFSEEVALDECGHWIIYNRWGSKVFESESPGECWDGLVGKSKKRANEGVYFYIFTLGDFSITHFVQLIR